MATKTLSKKAPVKSTVEIINMNKTIPPIKAQELTYPRYVSNGYYGDSGSEDGYTRAYDALSKEDTDNSIDIDILTSVSNSINISLQLDAVPFCCGVLEVGGLDVTSNIVKGGKKPVNYYKEFAEVLDALVENNTGKTLIMNTNGKGASVHYEKALPLTKYWTRVKTFKNGGSGSTIQMWVSNNN